MQKNNRRITQPGKDTINKEEKPAPLQVLADFCDTYKLDEANEILWECITTAISKSPSVYDTGRERSNLLFFYEKIKVLIETVYTINAQQEQPNPTKQAGTKNK
jgi:hypothetical protein